MPLRLDYRCDNLVISNARFAFLHRLTHQWEANHFVVAGDSASAGRDVPEAKGVSSCQKAGRPLRGKNAISYHNPEENQLAMMELKRMRLSWESPVRHARPLA